MKVIKSKGTGFPDYTDILHRISIQDYERHQEFFYFSLLKEDISSQVVEIEVPIMQYLPLTVYRISISTSVNVMIVAYIGRIFYHNGTPWAITYDMIDFGYQNIDIKVDEGILYKPENENMYLYIAVHSSEPYDLTVNIYGSYESVGTL